MHGIIATHAPNLFQFSPRNGLFVGNDGKRFECRLRKAFFHRLAQVCSDRIMESRLRQKLKTIGNFDDFKGKKRSRVAQFQIFDTPQYFGFGELGFKSCVQNALDFLDRNRVFSRKNQGFNVLH